MYTKDTPEEKLNDFIEEVIDCLNDKSHKLELISNSLEWRDDYPIGEITMKAKTPEYPPANFTLTIHLTYKPGSYNINVYSPDGLIAQDKTSRASTAAWRFISAIKAEMKG